MWIKSHTALSVSEETILNMSGTITTDHVVETLKEIILVDEDEENSEGGDYVLISTQNPHAQFLSLPIWHYDMRDKVRDVGFFSDATRQFWWPIIVRFPGKQDIEHLPDIPLIARKKLTRLNEGITDRKSLVVPLDLSWDEDTSENIAYNVVRLLVGNPDTNMEDPGLVQPFIMHISNIISNTAICYSMVDDMLKSPKWYMTTSVSNYRIKLLTFKHLVKRRWGSLYAMLTSIGGLEDVHLNSIFVEIFTDLLPTHMVNRVVDMYLLDGVKVLYRYGLALIRMFKRDVKSNMFRTGNDFWAHIRSCRNSDSAINFAKLHARAFDLNKAFYKKSVVPGRDAINDIEDHIRNNVSPVVLGIPLSLKYTISVDNTERLLNGKSEILDLFLARKLYTFLPPLDRLQDFHLAFATYKNGWNIHSLYNRVKQRSPCIILIKSVDAQAVIGMYLTCTLSPSPLIKGDGECFCFRLDGPKGACYRWAQHAKNTGPLLEPDVYHNSMTFHQFALCTSDFLSFGGSAVHATNAIRITSDLTTCSSGHSDTYNNPPLVPEETRDPFDIADMEIFCGGS